MNTLTIIGIIAGVLSTILLILGQSQDSDKDKKEIIDSGQKGSKEITNRLDEKAKYEKILITPPEIIIPARASRDVPITVTNNYPYPVFMVVVEITVQEGEIDLSRDFVPFGSGVWQSKYVTCQIPQINRGDAVTYTWNINGGKYENPSKVKLSIAGYLKEPTPDFTLPNMDSLPQTITVPKGFVPPMNDNK